MRHRRFGALDALLVASAVVPALLFGLVATYDRAQSLRAVERDLLATLDTLHGHAAKVLQFQTLVLGAVDERLRGHSAAGLQADPTPLHAHLRALQLHAGEALGIVVFGPDGRPLADSERPRPPREVDVTDRDYFRWHREHDGAVPFVAAPVRSRAAGGAATFFVTKRWSIAPDGRFGGVVAAGLRQATFIDYWQGAAPAPDSLVVLFRDDGTILARRPPVDPDQGLRIEPHAPLAIAVTEGRERQVVEGTSPLDGTERLFAYRRIERFPSVYIAHGVSTTAALGPWRRRMAVYGTFAAAVSLALSWLAVLARRRARALAAEVRERSRAEWEVRELNQGLERRITERTAEIRAGEARVRLLAREVDHRAKNALAVVQAALRLTPRDDVTSFAQAVEGRVSALARAQTLLSADRWRGASLQGLLEGELAPFLVAEGGTEARPQAVLHGPSVLLPAAAAQPLAMAIHELATNALKYGALSTASGRVEVTWRLVGEAGAILTLSWAEAGGPPLEGPPERRGFGSRVLASVVRGQLGGTLALHWGQGGLVCDIELPLARFEGVEIPAGPGGEAPPRTVAG
ncbi:MAG TPA: HWE histidine kinase domain-containing protein [Acetobacteraceae bacterium]|nr:HWE histidine kinase domain-containing protein [Acetobacteraceae bacterium]